MFDPSFIRSKYGNEPVEVFGTLVITTIMTIMIILTMTRKTIIMIVITK